MAQGYPDWVRGVTAESGAPVGSGAPDWVRLVEDSSAPAGSTGYLQYSLAASVALTTPGNLTLLTTASLAIGAYFCVGFMGFDAVNFADVATLAIVATQTQTNPNNTIQSSSSLTAASTYGTMTISGVLVLNVATTLTLQGNARSHANNIFAAGGAGGIFTGLSVLGPLSLI
jgi:hypothetical protein